MSRFFWYANVLFRLTCNSPPAATAAATTTPATAAGRSSRGPRSWTGRRTMCSRTCAPLRRPGSPAMMRTRRIAVDARPRMVIVSTRRAGRRRRRGCDHRSPCVANDRVLHNDRLVRGRLDARPVAMGTNGRPIGMCNHLHSVADRAERTVDVTAVDPGTRRDTPGREDQRRSRKNRQIVLVHNAPRFPLHKARRMKSQNLTKRRGRGNRDPSSIHRNETRLIS